MFVRCRPLPADCRSVRDVAAGLELANHTLPHNRVMGPVAYGFDLRQGRRDGGPNTRLVKLLTIARLVNGNY